MFCKNCGNEIKEGERFCSSCGTACGEDATGVPSVSSGKSFAQVVSDAASSVKKMLSFKPIFDTELTRTPARAKLASRWFYMLICNFLLVVFWLMNSMYLSIPLAEEVTIDLSISGVDVISMLSQYEVLMQEVGEFSDIPESLMIILGFIIFVFFSVTVMLCISPLIPLLSLAQRTEHKRLWLILERVAVISSFVVQCIFFFSVLLFAIFINDAFDGSTSGMGVSFGLNFWGIVFLALYIWSFVLLGTIRKSSESLSAEKAGEVAA